jgi:hypothetical protein
MVSSLDTPTPREQPRDALRSLSEGWEGTSLRYRLPRGGLVWTITLGP